MQNTVLAFDKQTARTIDADGRMRVRDCVLSTAEVNPYLGQDIPGYVSLGLEPSRVYQMLRDADELKKAARTFEGVPLLLKHVIQSAGEPQKEYQAGSVYAVKFEDATLRGDLLVSDGVAIELIESNELSDLSCAYRYVPDMTPGVMSGVRYDGIMRKIDGNHVAFVKEGRATGAHVADQALKKGDSKMAEKDGSTPTAAVTPEPAAVAPEPTATGGNADMAAMGAALKHIATLLESLTAKMNAPAATGAEDDMTGGDDETPQNPQVAEDGDGESDGSGATVALAAGSQAGTGARGDKTPIAAMDARIKKAVEHSVKQERERTRAILEASREVRGVLGEVHGLDSAGAVYREALRQIGVEVKDLACGSEKAAWQGYKLAVSAAAGAHQRGNEFALDAAVVAKTQSKMLDHLAKISNLG